MPSNLPLNELSLLFARLHRMLLTEETATPAVRRLAEAARETIPGSAGAGVSLIDCHGRRTSTGATDQLVTAADDLQYRLGNGPCLDAWSGAAPVRSPDLANEDRWPEWSRAAAGMGIHSVLSVPLIHRSEVIGALKIYSLAPAVFDDHSEHLLALFADPAATLLANVQSQDEPHRVSRKLKDAIASRDTIALARGILMGRQGLSSDEAMRELIGLSRGSGLSLRSVSEQVIESAGPHRRG